jgi:Fe-S-cluster containining protein
MAAPKFVFTCQQCGNCCKLESTSNAPEGIPVFYQDIQNWVQMNKIYEFFPHLQIGMSDDVPQGIILQFKKANNEKICPFLSENKCKVWTYKPIYCTAFPLGYNGKNYVLMGKICAGLNKGKMTSKTLAKMRETAVRYFNAKQEFIQTFSMIQTLLVKKIHEESQKLMEKLTPEQRDQLKSIMNRVEK